MLGHPILLFTEKAGDAEGHAFFAEQRVAPVAGAEAPDGVVDGEVADKAALGIAVADAVETFGEVGLGFGVNSVASNVGELSPGDFAHTGHDSHADGDVDGVGNLHADAGQGRANGAHDEGNDIHRAAGHAAIEEAAELGIGGLGFHPIVGGSGPVLAGGADERELFAAGDIVGVAAMEVAVGELLLVESDKRALTDAAGDERFFLFG